MLKNRGEATADVQFNSLRRHYPVQVIGYDLSLLRKHPGNSVVKRMNCKFKGIFRQFLKNFKSPVTFYVALRTTPDKSIAMNGAIEFTG